MDLAEKRQPPSCGFSKILGLETCNLLSKVKLVLDVRLFRVLAVEAASLDALADRLPHQSPAVSIRAQAVRLSGHVWFVRLLNIFICVVLIQTFRLRVCFSNGTIAEMT